MTDLQYRGACDPAGITCRSDREYTAPTQRVGRDWPQARDHMPPGLELMLLPLAFALNAADVYVSLGLRGR